MRFLRNAKMCSMGVRGRTESRDSFEGGTAAQSGGGQ